VPFLHHRTGKPNTHCRCLPSCPLHLWTLTNGFQTRAAGYTTHSELSKPTTTSNNQKKENFICSILPQRITIPRLTLPHPHSSDGLLNPQNSQLRAQTKQNALGKYLYQPSIINLEKSSAKKNRTDFQNQGNGTTPLTLCKMHQKLLIARRTPS